VPVAFPPHLPPREPAQFDVHDGNQLLEGGFAPLTPGLEQVSDTLGRRPWRETALLQCTGDFTRMAMR
jgi:hypothetical protein